MRRGFRRNSKPTASELEMAWVFHSGIFYYGVRKYIYESPVLESKEQMISDALDAFLAGFERVFGSSGGQRARAGEGGRTRRAEFVALIGADPTYNVAIVSAGVRDKADRG